MSAWLLAEDSEKAHAHFLRSLGFNDLKRCSLRRAQAEHGASPLDELCDQDLASARIWAWTMSSPSRIPVLISGPYHETAPLFVTTAQLDEAAQEPRHKLPAAPDWICIARQPRQAAMRECRIQPDQDNRPRSRLRHRWKAFGDRLRAPAFWLKRVVRVGTIDDPAEQRLRAGSLVRRYFFKIASNEPCLPWGRVRRFLTFARAA